MTQDVTAIQARDALARQLQAKTSQESEDLGTLLDAAMDLEKQIEAARKSPLALMLLCFRAPGGGLLYSPPFYEEIDEAFRTQPRVLIELSRGSGKSQIALAAVLWAVGNNHNLRAKIVCENDKQALKRLAVAHEVIDNPNHIYHKIFPGVKKVPRTSKRKNNAGQLNIERDLLGPDPTIEALGVTSAGTGSRSEILLLDDIVGAANALAEPAKKIKILEKLQNDWLNIGTPNSLLWAVYTIWAELDAMDWLVKQHPDWCHIKHAHGKPGDPYHSIFPELQPRRFLMAKRVEVGETAYARAYLLQPHTKETVAVLPEHLRPWDRSMLTPDKVMRAHIVLTVDPASGKKLDKGGLDPSGLSVMLYVPRLPAPPEGAAASNVDLDPSNYWTGRGVPFEIFIIEALEHYLPMGMEHAQFVWWVAEQFNVHEILVEAIGLADLHTWLEQERQTQARAILQRDPWSMDEMIRLFGSRGFGARVLPVGVGNLSKGQRLLNITPFLNIPADDPPAVFFRPQCISPFPEAQRLIHPRLGPIEVKRPLREQMLSFPARRDDVLDTITAGVTWITQQLVPRDAHGVFRQEADAGPPHPSFVLRTNDGSGQETANHQSQQGTGTYSVWPPQAPGINACQSLTGDFPRPLPPPRCTEPKSKTDREPKPKPPVDPEECWESENRRRTKYRFSTKRDERKEH